MLVMIRVGLGMESWNYTAYREFFIVGITPSTFYWGEGGMKTRPT